LTHALNEIFCYQEDDTFTAHAFVLNDGMKVYLTKYMPKWIAKGGRKHSGEIPDAYEDIKEIYLLQQHGKLGIDRMTRRQGGVTMQTVDDQATRIAKIAFERGANKRLGDFRTGSALDVIS
jgi:hypothetical protein